MQYEILKNYLLLKMEKDSYINTDDIKLLIKAIDKTEEKEYLVCSENFLMEEEK